MPLFIKALDVGNLVGIKKNQTLKTFSVSQLINLVD